MGGKNEQITGTVWLLMGRVPGTSSPKKNQI